mmetsp:Transcript_3418/g.7310  ORF Transcript_3418/g.7310 Transcript_3418/m.7310 type:complete len:287 (-) Transcript_3418:142-1002(-)
MASDPPYYRGHAYMSGRTDIITDERGLDEIESEIFDSHCSVVAERSALLDMKEKGFIRNRDVAASWHSVPARTVSQASEATYRELHGLDPRKSDENESLSVGIFAPRTKSKGSFPFDPVAGLGGGSWQRVVTEQVIVGENGNATGRKVSELLLNDCLRADLNFLSPLLYPMNRLKILHLHDNRHLTGLLENIRFRSFPLLEQLSLQRTNVETRQGLAVLSCCQNLKYVDVSACKLITGDIPRSILIAPGLRLNVVGSGVEKADTVGNEARSRSRRGNFAARRPGGA